MSRVLVIGYGNPLRGDDGLGWRVAEQLADQTWDHAVEIMAIHQLTPELAAPISQAHFVLFIDAQVGLVPGDLSCARITPADPASAELPSSTHHLTPSALMTWAKELFSRCPDAVAVSIVGKSFAFGLELSDVVQAAMPRLLETVSEIIQQVEMGHSECMSLPLSSH